MDILETAAAKAARKTPRNPAWPQPQFSSRRKPMRSMVCLGYALLFLLGACAPPAAELRLGVSPWPGNAPFIQAGDESRLGSGVRVVEFSSETATLQAFRNRTLEAAILTLDETLLLAAEGLPLRVAALTDLSAGAGKIMARPGVRGMNDLRGRRVAVESTAVGAFILAHALRDAGMALADVEMVALLPHEQAREYAAGRIDAAVGHEPYSSRLEQLGARAIFDTGHAEDDILRVLVVHDAGPEIPGERLRALAGALLAAQAEFPLSDATAAAQAARRYGLSPAEMVRAWAGLRPLGEQGSRAYFADDAARLRALLAHIQDEMLAAGIIERPPASLAFGVPR